MLCSRTRHFTLTVSLRPDKILRHFLQSSGPGTVISLMCAERDKHPLDGDEEFFHNVLYTTKEFQQSAPPGSGADLNFSARYNVKTMTISKTKIPIYYTDHTGRYKLSLPLSMIFSTIGRLSLASSSLAAVIQICLSVGMFSRALFKTCSDITVSG